MDFIDRQFLSLSSSLALTALLVAGCPGDDAPADTDDATESSGTAASTSTSTGPDPDGTTTPDPTTSSSTSGVDETSSGGAESTSTGEPPPEGSCAGLDLAGMIDTVLSREGAPIELTCDPNPMPCGGDPVGEWVVETSCGYEAYPNFFEEQCPGSTLAVQILSQVGTFSFEEDGTFFQDLTTQVQFDLALDPMTCLGIDCDTWQMLLEEDAPSVTCQSMGATCDCEIVQDPDNDVAMGTYEVQKETITITVDGEAESFPYCTQSDRFDLWSPLFGIPELTEIVCTDDRECVDAIGDMYDVVFCAIDER